MIFNGPSDPIGTLAATGTITLDATGQYQRHLVQLVATGDWSVLPQTSLDGGTTWAAIPPGTATTVTAASSSLITIDFGGPIRLLCTRTGGSLYIYARHADDVIGAAR